MYRELHHAQQDLERLREELRSALLAEATREIVARAGEARRLAVQIEQELGQMVDPPSATGSEHSAGERIAHEIAHAASQLVNEALNTGTEFEREHIEAARRAVSKVITEAQSVELGTSAAQMRPALIECKTSADVADAYLREALGSGQS